MSVTVQDGCIVVAGRCPVDDAETLLLALQDQPEAQVDLSGAEKLHLAVLQVLLALQPAICEMPASAFLPQNFFEPPFSHSDSKQDLS